MITITQEPTGGDLGAVGRQLDDAFAVMKDAAESGDQVLVVVQDGDLLGQGDPADAAVACALLGMVRTQAIEGAKKGRQLNVVSRRGADDAVQQVADGLFAVPGLSGQLVRVGTAHLGKVPV